ncbi:hypothetical protein DL95DRAFT_192544 [Leptodontidium sp. 2 PMI_412]|nr:hypothetical protein DL95DRAFT_192544 [Leptodontidium sp. 2 PMI_412]
MDDWMDDGSRSLRFAFLYNLPTRSCALLYLRSFLLDLKYFSGIGIGIWIGWGNSTAFRLLFHGALLFCWLVGRERDALFRWRGVERAVCVCSMCVSLPALPF